METARAALSDYGPYGKSYDFRSRCPVHNGGSRDALHVWLRADGAVAMYCHRCHANGEAVMKALGRDVRELFPPGHHNARRLPVWEARRSDFTADCSARHLVDNLHALEHVGAEWYGELRFDCPHCGSPVAVLQVSSRGLLDYSCPGDDYSADLGYTACTLHQCEQALAAKLPVPANLADRIRARREARQG